MDILIIALLVLLGLILIVAEILLLPGLTVAAIGSVASLLGAIYLCYVNYGLVASAILLLCTVVAVVITLVYSLRSKSLKKISLEENIVGKSSENADVSIALGSEGITTTRLAPMGNVSIDGMTFEAKSVDGYIDARMPIKVMGFENSIVIVSNC